MQVRALFVLIFILFSFHSVAQESKEATAAIETLDKSNVTNTSTSATPPNVEVGRHVMGNVDAGSMILSLLAVLVAIGIAAWLLKKLQMGGTTVNGLKVVTSLSLGSKERLVVVQVGEKQLLLGITGQQINLLDTLAKPIEIKSGVPIDINQTIARFSRKS